ncbi:MAG: helix-turn-helix domain-containing protein [Anaerolineae bacterium]|nr:helix-turn-helix domain-containing protein [Anaerolineae bacterium]
MPSTASTLGRFIADLMAKHDHTNRSLAAAAGVSESAIRNLLKVGEEKGAKDPDARTLSLVAKALDVDALRLFRLAGYIPPEPSAHSIRADYLAEMFDVLPTEKQDAVLGVLEAMIDQPERREAIQEMRQNPENLLAGIDLANPGLARTLANELIAEMQMKHANEVTRIRPEIKVLQYIWKDLPASTQQRVKSLIEHKLSLDYDPTMVDPEWRD